MAFEVPAREFGRLPDRLYEQLVKVEPSTDGMVEYRPCRVQLKDGRIFDRVYVVECRSYVRAWGVWPDQDPNKRSIRIEDVIAIEESPVRMPAHLANKMYAAGESGMGYCVFVLVLRDGRRLPYMTGNAVDFPDLPEGVTTDAIADLLPHARERQPGYYRRSAEYYWCLYRSDELKGRSADR